jgi:DNA helicase-2/ATP-dependent DNA helicase PcrA
VPQEFVPDPRQLEAIEHVHGPMLVLAGAGTGKTTVLKRRLANLINRHGVRPQEILAITYTENAAAQLCTGVQGLVPHADCSELRACTFHAYANSVLHGCGKSFGVLDPQDLWIYLRQRIQDLPLKHYVVARDPGEFLDALCDFFSRCHDELCDVDRYSNYVASLRSNPEAALPRVTKSSAKTAAPSREEVLERCAEIAAVFRKVEELLAAENLGTFGHMIFRAWEVLHSRADVLARERERARFILIDEFQDCNFGQIKLAHLLAGEARNLFAVGDPDQAIYRFRGASSAAFDEFLKLYPDTRRVALQRNHRSTPAILEAAHTIISHNAQIGDGAQPVAWRKEWGARGLARQPLISARHELAKKKRYQLVNLPVEIVITSTAPVAQPPAAGHAPAPVPPDRYSARDAEAADIAQRVREEHDRMGCPWSRFAVLYRQHSHRDQIVRELLERGVPFQVVGVNGLDTPEVRDLLACLRAVHSPAETESLFRVAALPQFGIAAEAMRDALTARRDAGLASILNDLPAGSRVLSLVEEIRDKARRAANLSAVFEIVITAFGLPRDSEPLRAFRQFIKQWEKKPIIKTGSLEEFLQYMEYFPAAGGTLPLWGSEDFDAASEGEGAVRLMTVHAAKGLEFQHVFLIRANQGSFPAGYREPLFEFPAELRESAVVNDDRHIHREEERRLFYVGMTRSRDTLAIYAQPSRSQKDPRPAGFLRDLMPPTTSNQRPSPCWRQRPVREYVAPAIHAAAAAASGMSAWLLIPPRFGPDPVLSASAVQTYEQCPLRFKLDRDWKIPGPVAAQMQFGSAMHAVLKGYFDSVLAGRTMDEAQVLELFAAAMAEHRFEDEHQRELYVRDGAEQLRRFLARQAAGPQPTVLSTERDFRIALGGVRLRGRIDRIDSLKASRVAVLDYKTGKPWNEKDADSSLQLSIYFMAARELGYDPERLVIYNLQDNTEIFTSREPHQLEEATERVCAAAESIAAGKFDPNPNYHCHSCSYQQLCPATEKNLVPATLLQ